MSINKKVGYLFLLLGLWGLLTFYQMAEFSSPEGESPMGSNLHAGKTTNLPPIKAIRLEKDFPNARQSVKLANPRNIFAPLELSATGLKTASSQTKLQTPVPPTPIKQTPPVAPPGPSAAELAAQRARTALNQYRFLGFLTKGGESQAFLTNGQAIYIVKQGEMVEGRIQVNKIESEMITLSTTVLETGNVVQASIPLTPGTHG